MDDAPHSHAPPQRWAPGMVLGGKYALIRQLGRGAVGTVFEALNTWTNRRVAVKILAHAHGDEDELVRRFIQEAHAASSIRHPNIVDVLDLDRDPTDGSLFLVLEYVAGRDLRALLNARGKLSVEESLELLVPVLGALRAAHSAGIVHRDLKPENVVLAEREGARTPKLIDFGVSKMLGPGGRKGPATALGTLLGTPEYMAPEQAMGLTDVDQRADVWAVGAMLFEMLAGRCPFEAPNPINVLALVIQGDVPRIERFREVDPLLASIVHGALETDRARRTPTVDALLHQLMSYARERTSHAPTLLSRFGPSLEHHAPEGLAKDTLPIPSAEGFEVLPSDVLEFEEDERAPGDPSASNRVEAAMLSLQRAVAINDLQRALASSETLVGRRSLTDEQLGRALVLRGTTLRWLGRLGEAADAFASAMERLAPAHPAYFSGLWQRAWSLGQLGRHDELPTLADAYERASGAAPPSEERVCAGWKLAAVLLRAGMGRSAEGILGLAQSSLDDSLLALPRVRAVVAGARAELAALEGEASEHIDRTIEAAECYAQAGDAREASVHRVMLADALAQLGAYEEARAALADALDVAAEMHLGYVRAWARGVDATCVLYGEDTDDGVRALLEARAEATAQGHALVASQCAARAASGLLRARRLDEAEALVNEELATPQPPEGYVALLGLEAQLALRRDNPDEAVRVASEGFALARASGGAGASDAAIRLTYAKALVATGQEYLGWGVLVEARRRLYARAKGITRDDLRQSFLERVPLHAETLRLGARWLDAG